MMMMMNLKTGEIDFENFFDYFASLCCVGATAAEREPARQQTQQQHDAPSTHKSNVMDGWELMGRRESFFFSLTGLCVWPNEKQVRS